MLFKIYQTLKDSCIAFYKNIFEKETITLAGTVYPYFYHRRNKTWTNERALEIPLIWKVVSESRGKRILEVGNVLSRYFQIKHEVIDKYEKNPRVLNVDAAEFKSATPYDLIVSISTLEHVGFDEQPVRPEKVLEAINNLKNLLAANGEMHLTLPAGYNKYLDDYIDKGKLFFSRAHYFKRDAQNKWWEVRWSELKEIEYHKGKLWYANGLIYGIIRK